MNDIINEKSNIAVYLRKSRETQDSEDTLRQHRQSLREYIDRNGFQYVEWYEEIASGETIDARPIFAQLLSHVESGEFDGVLVVHEDRLSRGDQYEQGRIQRIFKDSGTLLLTPNGITDFNNFDHVFQSSLKGLMSNHELEQIRRRMTEGKKRAVKDGRSHTGRVPFPYVWDKNTKTAVINEAQYKNYRRIVDMYVNKNMSMSQIAQRLTSEGIANSRGESRWITSSISKILKNRFHLGYVFHGRYKSYKVKDTDAHGNEFTRYTIRDNPNKSSYIEVKGDHQPVKSEEEHAIIMELLTKRGTPRKRDRRLIKHTQRLTSLIRCPYCEKVITVINANNGTPHVQKCHGRSRDGKDECRAYTKGIKEEVLYKGVIEHVKRYKDELFAPSTNEDKNTKKLNALRQQIDNYSKVIDKSRNRIERSKDMAIEGLIETDEFREIKQRESSNIKNAETEIDTLRRESDIVDEVKSNRMKERFQSDDVVQLLENDDGFTKEETNEILRKVIDHITYVKNDHDEVTIEITYS